MLGQIVDWFYGQIVGFLGNFFSEMGNMGAELFAMSWVQSVVLFFSYLGWALFAIGLVVACFECGVEYSGGRGNVKETALNAMKGFLAVSLFTQVPVRLYELAVSLQADLTAGITGFGTTSIGDAAKAALEDFNAVESLTSSGQIILRGFGPVTSGLMVIFCLALMAYAVIKVFFANLKRGGILLIQIAVGSLYMFSVPRGYGDGFIQWCKQVVGLCLTAFLQATILVAGLMVFKDHALLGLGLMLSAGEIPRIAGAFGLDTLSISWRRQRIEYILKNEKYKGDAILQKSYTTESFPRKRKNNHGERNAYYMEDSHAAIVSDVDFETVQKIRAGHRRSTGITNTVLRGTLYCCCESPLRMRMSGQSVYWVCIRHSHNASACPITQIPEVQIQQAFLQLYYNLKHQGSHILPDLITNLQPIRERKFLWSVDVIELNKQIAELTSQNQLLTTLRESGCVDPDIFISKSNALTEQLRAAKQAKSRILNQDGDDTITGTQELLTILKRGPETLHDFDGELFGQLIDKVIIESNTSLRFRLKNGLELRESIERTVR